MRARVRLATARLDARIAEGVDTAVDPLLAQRAAQLALPRRRTRLARALERACAKADQPHGFSAAIPADRVAVQVARPALSQLVSALGSDGPVEPRGVALSQLLLTGVDSPLYRPEHRDSLYEAAREALLALRPERSG
jgi:hypothetical protein